MKKSAYKGSNGSSFRTCFHSNRKTNGCAFRKVLREKEGRHERKL